MNPDEAYRRAVTAYENAMRYYKIFVASEGKDAQAEKHLRSCLPPGLYEHWKSSDENGGHKFYVVQGVGQEKDTWRFLVSCVSLYRPHNGKLLLQPLLEEKNGVMVPLSRGAYGGPRFRLVCELTPRQILTLLQYAGELALQPSRRALIMHSCKLVNINPIPILV